MRRIATISIIVAGIGMASFAAARPLDMQPAPHDAIARATPAGRTDLMRQWATVGKCVVDRDRASSLAFVRSAAGSDDASDAARRLDPVFARCLAGSRVPGPSSVVLRRAALAQALGIAGRSI